AAVSIEQPNLVAARFAGSRGSERQILAVGTPTRGTLAFAAERDLAVVAAVDVHHPDVRVRSVRFVVDCADDVGHPVSVRRHLRIADVAKAVQVVEFERTSGGLCSGCGCKREQKEQDDERLASPKHWGWPPER